MMTLHCFFRIRRGTLELKNEGDDERECGDDDRMTSSERG